ncbi:MAG: superoxide dismutase [Candidatus Sungbacteria bacterium]|nr:superoxide dismutase [Candidatus Sungbacteria bacterium]
MREQKPLKYTILEGISEKQLKEHHDVLYAGYVKKWNEIQEKLKTVDRSQTNATYSDYGEMKREETFALNGIKLHEGYFDNMMQGGSEPAGVIKEWIEKDFGSYEKWQEDFKALGIAARGWAVLAFDLDEGKLYNFLCDSHNQGGVWNSVALFIMDVYEHAYFVDFATGRKSYIETFFKNINWNYVNQQIEKFKLEQFRK